MTELPLNQIIHGDAFEVMKEFPDASIDAVVTDPPFFVPTTHYQSRNVWQRTYADVSPLRLFWLKITEEVKRILKPDGHFLVFCNCDSFPTFYVPMYNHFEVTKSLVWDKKHVGFGRIWRHQHELIIAARNKECKVNENGRLYRDVIAVKITQPEDRTHPVQKPVKLLKYLIEPITLQNDIVLDPFCGSGTTLIAAQQLRRNWIGVDLNLNYVDTANKNLEKYTLHNQLLINSSNETDISMFTNSGNLC